MKTKTKRATVYLDAGLHKALKIKSAQNDTSISDLINQAVKLSLEEDLQDLNDFNERIGEPNIDYRKVLKDLKDSGKL